MPSGPSLRWHCALVRHAASQVPDTQAPPEQWASFVHCGTAVQLRWQATNPSLQPAVPLEQPRVQLASEPLHARVHAASLAAQSESHSR